MFQYKARYIFYQFFFLSLRRIILHLVLIVWHACFNSFPSLSNQMYPRPILIKLVNGSLIYFFALRDCTTVFRPSVYYLILKVNIFRKAWDKELLTWVYVALEMKLQNVSRSGSSWVQTSLPTFHQW